MRIRLFVLSIIVTLFLATSHIIAQDQEMIIIPSDVLDETINDEMIIEEDSPPLPAPPPEPELSDVWPITNDTIRFMKNGKYGFVCNQRQVLVPFIYKKLPPNFSDFMISRRSDDMWGVINRKHEVVIPFVYSGISRPPDYPDFMQVMKKIDGKRRFGQIDLEGNIVLPIKFRTAQAYIGNNIFNGVKPTFVARTFDPLLLQFYDDEGRLLFETDHRQYELQDAEYIHFINKDFKHGALDIKGDIVLEPEYTVVYWIKDGIASARSETNKLINLESGKVIASGQQRFKEPDQNGTLIMHVMGGGGKMGIIKTNGTIIEPLADCSIKRVKETGIYMIAVDNQLTKIIDSDGGNIKLFKELPLAIKGLQNGYFAVKWNDSEWKVYDPNFKLVSRKTYTNTESISNKSAEQLGIEFTKIVCKVKTEESNWRILLVDGTEKAMK